MDSERKEFERWASDDFTSPLAVLKNADGIYKLMSVQQQWRAWEARAELGEGTPHCTKKLNALHVNHIALQAEFEALRKDAERWRMAKLVAMESMLKPAERRSPDLYGAYMKASHAGGDLEACIDAAMGKEKA